MNDDIGGWKASAEAWIESQSAGGDFSRREILDPCLRKIFMGIDGRRVLDLGCGEGRYARYLASQGAIVTGIDPIDVFIDQAKRLHPEGTDLVGRGEALPFEDGAFDWVLSYLSLVDILDYRSALAELVRVLAPDGKFVLATLSNIASTSATWTRDENGKKLHRSVDRYMEEFALELSWSKINIVNYHRPLSSLVTPLFAMGLVMDQFIEPLPNPASTAYDEEFRAPTFQVMTFKRWPATDRPFAGSALI